MNYAHILIYGCSIVVRQKYTFF